MGFSAQLTEEDTQETAGRIQEPVIAKANPTEIGPTTVGEDPEYPVITMDWILQDPEHVGLTFNHLEWQPRERDYESQNGSDPEVKNQMKRLLHVLQRVTTVEKDDIRSHLNSSYAGDSLDEIWDSVRSTVNGLVTKFGNFDRDFEIKIVGNDYNGGNLQFPRYPSFVRVVGEDPALSFNDYEKKQNAKYMQLQQETPDSDDEFGDDDVEFDPEQF